MPTNTDLASQARALDRLEQGAKDVGDLLTEAERRRVLAIIAKADQRFRSRMGASR